MTDATNRLICKVGLRRQGKHKKIQAQQDRQDSTEGGEERRSQTLLFSQSEYWHGSGSVPVEPRGQRAVRLVT